MWWYGLLVWLSVVMWGVQTVDLDQVHHLCQAREFHSFRRNVCSISKRSTTPGEYAEYLREVQERAAGGGGGCWGTGCRTSAGAGNVNHILPKFVEGLRRHSVGDNAIRSFLNKLLHFQQETLPIAAHRYKALDGSTSKDVYHVPTDSTKRNNIVRDIFRFHLLNQEPKTVNASEDVPPIQDEREIPFNNLYDQDNVMSTNGEDPTIPFDYYNDLSSFSAHSSYDTIPEVQDDHVSLNQRRHHYGDVPSKPRRDDNIATIGMLRKHCCINGCTLNRHFQHFLSTCSSQF